MTIHKAIEIIKEMSFECDMNRSLDAKGHRYGELYTALNMAITVLLAQNEAEKNEPLTVDELRILPLESWLWVEILDVDAFRWKEESSYYRKQLDHTNNEAFCCGYPGIGFEFEYEDYGKTWLAYRRPPKGENE